MSRTLSAAIVAAMNAQSTDKVFLTLLEIDHDDMAEPLRLVDNTEDINSDGETYRVWPFHVALAPEQEGLPVSVRLTIDNIDRTVIQALREISSAPDAPTVNVSIVTSEDWDSPEIGPVEFLLSSIRYDAFAIEGTLTFQHTLDDAVPAHSMDPRNFPGLHDTVLLRDEPGWEQPAKAADDIETPPRGWPRHGRFVRRRVVV
ncbi:MAG: DUF1833 family protein [Candidatus Eisenbacteria sp.]|nr:DUF1833 family protein [Candidatus Eisenbacteria bacterium]